MINIDDFERGFYEGLGFLKKYYPDCECLDIRMINDRVSFHLSNFNNKLRTFNIVTELRENGSRKSIINFGDFELEMWKL